MKIFDQLRAINGALFGVLRAEFDALSSDLTVAGKRLLTGLLLVLVTLGVAAVLLAVLVFVIIALLSLWLPPWGAGLVVAGVLALGAALCWMAAMRRLRGETPVEIVSRHVNDHLEWWQTRVGSEGPPPNAAAVGSAVLPDEDLP